MFRGVKNERAPTAANVEEALASTQTQFVAEIIEFSFLRRIEVIVRRLEVGTGIYHLPIQPEPIKIIRNVVMEGHCAPITFE